MSLELTEIKLQQDRLIGESQALDVAAEALNLSYRATVKRNNTHLRELAALETSRTAASTAEAKEIVQAQINLLQGPAEFSESVLNIKRMFAAEKLWQDKLKEKNVVDQKLIVLAEKEKELKQASWKAKQEQGKAAV